MAEASTIKIKRSGVSGNPTTLKTGELAYSWFEGEGGNRLYIGTGTESEGNAADRPLSHSERPFGAFLGILYRYSQSLQLIADAVRCRPVFGVLGSFPPG